MKKQVWTNTNVPKADALKLFNIFCEFLAKKYPAFSKPVIIELTENWYVIAVNETEVFAWDEFKALLEKVKAEQT